MTLAHPLSVHGHSLRPPKKSWKKIFNLSGGEKTLSSLALVFALHHFKPTPLYFMDEIDAALDFKNVSIVACYIYVSISHAGSSSWDSFPHATALNSICHSTPNSAVLLVDSVRDMGSAHLC